jgi:hypothetical protein
VANVGGDERLLAAYQTAVRDTLQEAEIGVPDGI